MNNMRHPLQVMVICALDGLGSSWEGVTGSAFVHGDGDLDQAVRDCVRRGEFAVCRDLRTGDASASPRPRQYTVLHGVGPDGVPFAVGVAIINADSERDVDTAGWFSVHDLAEVRELLDDDFVDKRRGGVAGYATDTSYSYVVWDPNDHTGFLALPTLATFPL